MIPKFLAQQLRKPTGFIGKFVMGRLLNKTNIVINTLVIDTLAVQPEDSVLELGFGGGAALLEIARRAPKGKITGVDFSPEMVRGALRDFADMVCLGRADFHEADVVQLPFADHSFHKVLTVNTIYFWPDPVAGLREIRRVVKPGGKLVIGLRSEEKMAPLGFGKQGFRLFTAEMLRLKLTEAGFVHVEILHADKDKPLDSLLGIATA